MEEENNKVGEFGFAIMGLRQPDGNTEYQTSIINQNIPSEVIIMQLKAFLANVEKDYFDKFNETVGSFREE